MMQEIVNRQGERERAALPLLVDPVEVLKTVDVRVAVPLREGNLPKATRAVFEIWEELFGNSAERDIFEDPVSAWLDDDKVCGVLYQVGIITMLDFMERRPIDFLKIPQIGETVVRKLAQVQSRFRYFLERETERKSALPSEGDFATMSL